MQNNSSVSLWEKFFDERVRGHKELVYGYLRYVNAMEEKGIPPIFELRHLALMLAVEESFLVSVIQDSTYHYREFSIPKRSGGYRNISVPSPTLLHAQRWITQQILYKIPVNDAVHGFVPNRSIITNAERHLGNKMILKMDLANFFPSIKFKSVMKLFLGLGYSVSVSFFLSKICCNRGSLPQGAATSPVLSNLVAGRLDVALSNYAGSSDLTYTRYADDITLSGDRIESQDINRLSWIVEKMGFIVNKNKTRISGPKGKKIITGISISSGKLALPRSSVRSIKLEAHKLLKNGYYKHMAHTENFDPLLMEKILGRINFWIQVDPLNRIAIDYRDKLSKYITSFRP